jgi:Protein of unknown function, DUF604
MRPFIFRIFCSFVLSSFLAYVFLRRNYTVSGTFGGTPVKHFVEPWPQREQCPFAASPLRFSDSLTARTYTRGIIRPHFNHDPRPPLGRIDEPLLHSFLSEPNTLTSKYARTPANCSETTIVHVGVDPDPDPGPDDDNTKKILFGAATTVERLDNAFHRLVYFAGGTKASMIALVPPADNLEEKQTYFRTRGLDIVLIPSELDFTLRHFSLVRAFNLHVSKSRSATEWMIIVDDDTFFPSLSLVSERLSTMSSSKPYWIGAVSEASWQVRNFGRIGFGGAGIVLSRNLVETLDKFYDECTGEELGQLDMPGDQRLGKCIKKAIPKLKLTVWNELHQWDMKPEPHGLFEAGKPIWSFHHFRGGRWGNADMIAVSTVATVAGDKSLLRRWAFNSTGSGQQEDRDFWILTNGYSIVHYHVRAGAPDINFEHTEHTWADAAEGYEESLGPLRPVEEEGVTKKRWLLRDAVKVGANVHQFYWYESATENSVIEIVWLGADPKSGALLE